VCCLTKKRREKGKGRGGKKKKERGKKAKGEGAALLNKPVGTGEVLTVSKRREVCALQQTVPYSVVDR
jgi:hypothetical protein